MRIVGVNVSNHVLVWTSCRFANYIQEKDEMDQRPVFTEDGYTFVYIKYNNLYLMSVTKRNSNIALMLVYLYRLVDVFKVSLLMHF